MQHDHRTCPVDDLPSLVGDEQVDELDDARWFEPDEVRAGLARDWADADGDGTGDDAGIVLSAPISIARWLAERWLEEVTGHAGDRG